MKKQLTGSVVIFSGLFIFLAGCLVNPPKHNMQAKYKKALQLENTGNFYFKENEADSALKSYRKSLALYIELADSTPAEKDTLFRYKMAYLYSCISTVFDTLHHYDSALAYDIKSLHLISNKENETENREILNYDIALYYKKLGDKKGIVTDSGKAYYKKGIPYALSACWEKDSLGEHTETTLWAYHLAMNMYSVTGDTIRKKFYRSKYTELYNAIYPSSAQNPKSTAQSTKPAIAKPSGKTTKDDFEDRFIKSFNKGFERGWNKHHTNTSNSNNGTLVSTSNNADGTTTTVTTTIENGIETITTEVNGVVVKKETKKLN